MTPSRGACCMRDKKRRVSYTGPYALTFPFQVRPGLATLRARDEHFGESCVRGKALSPPPPQTNTCIRSHYSRPVISHMGVSGEKGRGGAADGETLRYAYGFLREPLCDGTYAGCVRSAPRLIRLATYSRRSTAALAPVDATPSPSAHPPVQPDCQTRIICRSPLPRVPGPSRSPGRTALLTTKSRAIPYRMSVVWLGLSIMLLIIGHVDHPTQLESR